MTDLVDMIKLMYDPAEYTVSKQGIMLKGLYSKKYEVKNGTEQIQNLYYLRNTE